MTSRRWTALAAWGVAAVYVPFWLSALGAWPAGSWLVDALLPVMATRFADVQVILTGFDCTGPGVDVQALNPCDPWRRPMNYPNLWLRFGVLGLGPSDAPWLGTAIGVAALAALLAWMAPRTARQALLTVLVLASPPVMLGVERANNDLLVLLLVLGAARALTGDGLRRLLGYLLLFAAFALKLFPLAALGRVLWEPRRRLLLAVAVAIAAGAYLWLIRGELRVLAAVVPQALSYSYGATILPMYAVMYDLLPEDFMRLAGLALTLPVMAAGAAWGRFRLAPLPGLAPAQAVGLDLGALLYLGTFLLGSNYDYRLVFPLLCWPAWVALAGGSDPAWRRLGRVCLGLVVGSYWLTFLMLDDPPLLALVFLCAAVLAARLPRGGTT